MQAPDRGAAGALLAVAVAELVDVACNEHGKDPAPLRPVEVRAVGTVPYFSRTDHATITLTGAAVAGDYRSQVLFQAAHEAAHAAITAADGWDWVDEMFATWFAVRVMRALNATYASETEIRLHGEARQLSTASMVAAALPRAVAEPYPPGLYGRALLTAQLLERTFGWPTVRELAHPGAPAQRADLTAWLRSLGAREQLARSVLGLRGS